MIGIAVGTAMVISYDATPGSRGMIASDWPAGTTLTLNTRRPTLFMFVHPHCPCTDASVAELATLMADIGDRIDARVVMFYPPGKDAEWTRTRLRRAAEAIPGVSIALDPEGRECRRFGAETSGHAYVYSPAGELLFEGGITASRAHAVSNFGRSAVTELAMGRTPELRRTQVFGCPILDLGDYTE